MQSTDILMQEHRIIEQVLSCLETLAERCETGGKIEIEYARDAVSFFLGFADRYHHGKEEDHLFPLMEARGFSSEAGPTVVMRSEHRQGRDHVRRLAETLESAAAGQPGAVEAFVKHTRAYAQLLRQHIQKEDHCLFPIANRTLSDEDDLELVQRFESADLQRDGEREHRQFRQLADRLADRLGISRAPASVAH